MAQVTTDLVTDRIEILDLMTRYGMAIDCQDYDLYRQVFTEDAQIDYSDSGGMRAGLEETIEWLKPGLALFVGLHHNMTNHLAVVEGDTARAITYFLAFHSKLDGKGSEEVMTMGGHYRDRLRRTADGWRISDRVELGIWMDGVYPEGFAPPPWRGTANHHLPQLPD